MADLIFPPSPTTGQEFTGTFGEVYTWDGEKWTLTAGGGEGGGASVTVSDTAPASPTQGDLWWDIVSGQLFIWYVDANSSQWVVANVSVGVPGPPGPAGPNVMPPGVTDGSNAAAGQIGEYISNVATSISVVTSNTQLLSLTIPPGDWDLTGRLTGYQSNVAAGQSPLFWAQLQSGGAAYNNEPIMKAGGGPTGTTTTTNWQFSLWWPNIRVSTTTAITLTIMATNVMTSTVEFVLLSARRVR